MPLSIDERLRLELERTSLRKLARTLPDIEATRRAVRIMDWADRLRTLAEQKYLDRRERRVDAERRRLIDAAGSPGRHLVPRWAATDRFDPVRTREQAERTVRARHERLLARIDGMETARLQPLVQDAKEQLRQGLHGLFALNARPGPIQSNGGPKRD